MYWACGVRRDKHMVVAWVPFHDAYYRRETKPLFLLFHKKSILCEIDMLLILYEFYIIKTYRKKKINKYFNICL